MFEPAGSRNANRTDTNRIGVDAFVGDIHQSRSRINERQRANVQRFPTSFNRRPSTNTGDDRPAPRLPKDVASSFIWSACPE